MSKEILNLEPRELCVCDEALLINPTTTMLWLSEESDDPWESFNFSRVSS